MRTEPSNAPAGRCGWEKASLTHDFHDPVAQKGAAALQGAETFQVQFPDAFWGIAMHHPFSEVPVWVGGGGGGDSCWAARVILSTLNQESRTNRIKSPILSGAGSAILGNSPTRSGTDKPGSRYYCSHKTTTRVSVLMIKFPRKCLRHRHV